MYVRNWLFPVYIQTLINTCREVPLQVNFFRWRHFVLTSLSTMGCIKDGHRWKYLWNGLWRKEEGCILFGEHYVNLSRKWGPGNDQRRFPRITRAWWLPQAHVRHVKAAACIHNAHICMFQPICQHLWHADAKVGTVYTVRSWICICAEYPLKICIYEYLQNLFLLLCGKVSVPIGVIK
jgi:hypothetical protein